MIKEANSETLHIVIPSYKGGDFLKRVLGCLMAQINDNFAVTVVCDSDNDADFKNEQETVEAFHNIGLNVSIVRNTGSHGAGEARMFGVKEYPELKYLSFIDVDDIVPPTMTYEFASAIAANENTPDESKWDIAWARTISQVGDGSFINDDGSIARIKAKVYRKPFIIDNGIRFAPVKINEDLGFNIVAHELANKILRMDTVTYIHLHNGGSLTQSQKNKSLEYEGYVEAAAWAADFLEKNGVHLSEDLGDSIAVVMHTYHDTLMQIDKDASERTRMACIKFLDQIDIYSRIMDMKRCARLCEFERSASAPTPYISLPLTSFLQWAGMMTKPRE